MHYHVFLKSYGPLFSSKITNPTNCNRTFKLFYISIGLYFEIEIKNPKMWCARSHVFIIISSNEIALVGLYRLG